MRRVTLAATLVALGSSRYVWRQISRSTALPTFSPTSAISRLARRTMMTSSAPLAGPSARRSYASLVEEMPLSHSGPVLPPSLGHLDSAAPQDGFVDARDAQGRRWTVFSRPLQQSPSDDRQYRCVEARARR
jgi:hypothetical protein